MANLFAEAAASAVAQARLASERQREQAQLHSEAEASSDRLRSFVKAAWPVVEPATVYQPNWHIDAICDRLEAVTAGEIRRLVITVPPGTMKSLTVSVFWPAWEWTIAPHLRWLFASYAQALATRDSLRCRRLIESQWYRRLYGDRFRLTSDQNVKTRYENDRTGVRLATSVDGGATGERGDRVVIDDPHKIEEADSVVIRQGVLEWFDQTMSLRLSDPQRGAQVLVQQRVHERDLAGHLIAKGWDVLCLPMEYEPRHPFAYPADPRSEPGELLFPKRFGPAEVEQAKKDLGSRGYAGQYQQRPAPAEGAILKRHWWRYYDPASPPHVWHLIQSWDTAFKDKTTNDWVVGLLFGGRGADWYLLRRVRGHWDLPETKRQIRAMTAIALAEHGAGGAVPQTVLVENRANGPEVIAELRASVAGIIPVNPKGDKTQRAHAVTPQLEAGNVFLPGFALPGKVPGATDWDLDEARSPASTAEFVHACAVFPAGEHDDDVDALTQALSRARMVDASVPPEQDFPVGAGMSGKIDESIGYEWAM